MSYVGYVLKERGIQIIDGKNNKIPAFNSKYDGPVTKFTRPFIEIDIMQKNFQPATPKYRRLTYEDIKAFGLMIISLPLRGRGFARQHVNYKLVKIENGGKEVKSIPEGHRVDYDEANRVFRFLGRNVPGEYQLLKK